MINFNFGKKKSDIKKYAIIAIVLSTIIAALSQCTGIKPNSIWDLFDEVQRRYFPQTILNDFVIKDPEKLDRRVKRDVDRAIDDYWTQSGLSKAEVSKPRYSETPVDASVCYTDECRSLGGEIRLCAPWLDNCPNQ
jgi:hypothetical protein